MVSAFVLESGYLVIGGARCAEMPDARAGTAEEGKYRRDRLL